MRGIRPLTELSKARYRGAGGRGLVDAVRRKAQLQAGGPVQELPIFSRQLGNGAASRGEGRVYCGELFPRVRFFVTTLEVDSRAPVRF